MSLADVMGGSGLSAWAEAGLLLTFAVFAAVTIRAFSRRNRESFERARLLPLEDEAPPAAAAVPGAAEQERN